MGAPIDRPAPIAEQAGGGARLRRPNLTLASSRPGPDVDLTDMLAEIDRLRTETERLRSRIRDLESLADTDPLLPLYNRRAFGRELARAVSLADRHGEALSLVFLDLNRFKAINDNYGHAAGDAVLLHVAEILGEHVRDSDIVGRLGGDEFGVILMRADEDAARLKAAKLAGLIETAPAVVDGVSHQVGVAWGVCARGADESGYELMTRADEAMYANKCQRPSGDASR